MVQANKEKIQQVLDLECEYLHSFCNPSVRGKKLCDVSRSISWTESEGEYDYTRLNGFFAQEKEDNKELRDIFIIESMGKVVASSNPESVELDLSDREYFQVAIAGETVISSLLQDRIEGESVLFVATPIRNQQNTIVGVMANIIDMNYVSTNMVQLVAPEVGRAYLIDQSGQIIFHTDRQRIGDKHKNPSINDYFTQLSPITYNGPGNYDKWCRKVFNPSSN